MATETLHHHEGTLDHARVGMIAFLTTEAVFFGTLILTYIFYMEQSRPVAAHAFNLAITLVSSVCLLSSSFTIHQATKGLDRGELTRFRGWLAFTILLGALFLVGTGLEWADLIGKQGITIATGMFGSTYFTLIGFHAAHVSMGLTLMTVVLVLAIRGHVTAARATPVEMVAWYWHFVDGVWVVIFCVVYLVGR
jgi:cytochrome c oxidase subunit 3/cytochrome o ubiquinol oxidase subunit 3